MIFCAAADTCEVEEVGDISGNSKYNLISTMPCMVQYDLDLFVFSTETDDVEEEVTDISGELFFFFGIVSK